MICWAKETSQAHLQRFEPISGRFGNIDDELTARIPVQDRLLQVQRPAHAVRLEGLRRRYKANPERARLPIFRQGSGEGEFNDPALP